MYIIMSLECFPPNVFRNFKMIAALKISKIDHPQNYISNYYVLQEIDRSFIFLTH